MLTRGDLTHDAKTIVQDVANVPLLLDASDYGRIFEAALTTFAGHRPSARVVHHTVASSAFRFVLSGSGALAVFAGLDAWASGSAVSSVWHPYDTTSPDNVPLDQDDWRVVREPGLVVLVLAGSISSGVLRIEFSGAHRVDAIPETVEAPPAPDVALAGAAGNLSAGSYLYAVVGRTANGVTLPGTSSAALVVTTPASNGQGSITVPPSPSEGVTSRDLYRTVANGAQLKYHSTIAHNRDETITDNVADGSLGANAPTSATAGGLSTLTAADEAAFPWLLASLVARVAATRFVQNTGTSSLPGDVVDRRSQSGDMARRADDLYAIYARMMGIPLGASATAAAGSSAGAAVRGFSMHKEIDMARPPNQSDWLTHDRRRF